MKCSFMCLVMLFVYAITSSATSQPAAAPTATGTPIASKAWTDILNHKYPRLVVLLSYDQLRWDYMTRFSDQFLPAAAPDGTVGGFRYFLEKGASFADARYSHLPTHTGSGHATMLTGASPSENGIVGNDWVTSSGRPVNCVEDPTHFVVGAPRGLRPRGVSPVNLLAPTVGDELLLANNRHSKIVGMGIKDRGAVLPAGHNPTACTWFDSSTGNWLTSTYYTTGTLPAFIARANSARISERWLGKSWNLLLPPDQYERSHGINEISEGQGDARKLGGGFPKVLGSTANKEYFDKMSFTPFAGEMILELAKLAVETEQLGADEYPDLLTLSFSNFDLGGHTWGAHSPEMQDMIIRSDRQVSDFLNYLADKIPGGLDSVVVVITGDHGVSPLPNFARAVTRMPSDRILNNLIVAAATEALASRFPDADTSGILSYKDPYIYFRLPSMLQQKIDIGEAETIVARAVAAIPGVAHAFSRTQIENRHILNSFVAEFVYSGYYRERCGDVILLTQPYTYASTSATGTTHGTHYSYDTNVPILFAGWNVMPGVHTTSVDIRDIAPTLSFTLGIPAPAASSGRILGEIYQGGT